MAIFKKTKKEKTGKTETAVTAKSVFNIRSYAYVLLSPRITEKATDLSEKGAYVFNVDPRANRNDIVAAVREVYGVTPRRVATMHIAKKRTLVRGRKGSTAGGKKAIVYLKKGEKIEFV